MLQSNESVDLVYGHTAAAGSIWIIIVDDRVAVAVRACANLGARLHTSVLLHVLNYVLLLLFLACFIAKGATGQESE